MYKQNLILENKAFGAITKNDLYYKLIDSTKERKFACKISLETYFNILNYAILNHHCDAQKVSITIKYKGCCDFLIKLRHKDGKESIVDKYLLSSKTSIIFQTKEISIASLPAGGYIFLEFCNLNNFFLFGGYYSSESPNYQKTDICIVICTYKKEEFVTKNVKILSKFCKDYLSKIYIVDNGNTLTGTIKESKLVKLIPNRNTGGTGGFTRGLIEALKNDHKYVILMDDDVKFCPETINRVCSLYSNLSEKSKDNWLGFSMLSLNNPTLQVVCGENWLGTQTIKQNNSYLDIRDRVTLLLNQNNKPDKTGLYSAWWAILMPTSIIKDQGLPFPFFIKFDDMEYGLRRPESTQIIFDNGLGVWHSDFESKTSQFVYYYWYRNSLITNAIYRKRNNVWPIAKFIKEGFYLIKEKKYVKSVLIFKAIDDYLKGTKLYTKYDIDAYNQKILLLCMKKYNFIKIVPYAIKYLFLFAKSLLLNKHVTSDFKKNFSHLCSYEYWNRYFQ